MNALEFVELFITRAEQGKKIPDHYSERVPGDRHGVQHYAIMGPDVDKLLDQARGAKAQQERDDARDNRIIERALDHERFAGQNEGFREGRRESNHS